MATYNGEKYVADQIRSLAAQSYDNLHLYVRDDGSSDQTVPILLKTVEREERRLSLHLEDGDHLGLPNSYFRLLQHVDSFHDYYAFADQDDVWFPTKVQHAVEKLRPLEDGRPLLYFCRQCFVTEKLIPLGESPLVPKPGLANALVQNPAKGCTQIFNKAALELLRAGLPDDVPWHDWWVYLTISALGTVVFDPRVEILYRIHRASTVGEELSRGRKMLMRVARLMRSGNLHARRQAQILLNLHGERLCPRHKEMIERFVRSHMRLKDRVRYACQMDVFRLDRWDTAALRLLIISGRY